MESLMNATVGQLIGGGLGIIAILSVFIEFTPIKLNPVSAFLNWIGRRTNRELFEKIGDLENKVDEIQSRQEAAEAIEEEREAVNCRIRILSFSDELRRNIRHSQESFDQVLSDIDNYEKYCDAHPNFKNNKTVTAKERIKAAYEGCMDQNDFL